MAIKTIIQDGEASSFTAGVTTQHALKVTNYPLSLKEVVDNGDGNNGGLDIFTREKFFLDNLRNSSGSLDLNVDGSSTAVDFKIDAENDKMKSIYTVRFVLNDTQLALGSSEGRRFGSAAATPGLTNGLRFFLEQGGINTEIFVQPIKQIAQFMHFTSEILNEAGALGAGEDILIVNMDFHRPINIVPGGIDRIVVQVQDDLTLINFFNVYAIGTQELL